MFRHGGQIFDEICDGGLAIFPAVSLNVRANNPVVTMYRRAGFTKILGSEVINRTGGLSFNMLQESI
jgi:ribosomal protein S18 acetylase RimI-like enzyme